VWVVLFYYTVTSFVLGWSMVLVFVLPHLVAASEFPRPIEGTHRVDVPWAVHQARVTLDFARDSRVWTWLLGGLNFHKEHHLFPTICHVNYPAMSQVVQETCRHFGLEYKEHASFGAGLSAHYRWLKRLGSAD
jgi:linoleoyl-CoA desaturase